MKIKGYTLTDIIVIWLIPRRVYWLGRNLRHPRRWWTQHKQLRWAKSVREGDIVATCMGVAKVDLFDPEDRFTFIGSDGRSHDLLACCGPYPEERGHV